MLCAACGKLEMFVLEFQGIEIDYCYRCGGVWLDSGELELIGRKAGALREDLLAALESRKERQSERRSSRRCPVCRRRMREVSTESDPPILVDRCPDEHGLWFERGELRSVVEASGAEGHNKLAEFFADLGTPASQTNGS